MLYFNSIYLISLGYSFIANGISSYTQISSQHHQQKDGVFLRVFRVLEVNVDVSKVDDRMYLGTS